MAAGTALGLALAPVGLAGAGAGADSGATLVGYNASALAIGAQFAFNVPNVVPLPNENLIEEDVPFSRTEVGSGPVVDSLGAPYYPGDIAADLGSLLLTFGAPPLPLNDPLLAESKYPTSPGYSTHATFGIPPSAGTALQPSIFSSVADSSVNGGDATGTISDLSLDNLSDGINRTLSATDAALAAANSALGLGNSTLAQGLAGSLALTKEATASLIDVANLSATNNVSFGASTVTASSATTIKAIDIAGMITIGGLTSTATATSDGTTGTPTASLRLGEVTVDGESAYIDATGVHIAASSSGTLGVTPAQLQQSVNATLAQDGISISVLSPTLTSSGSQATASAGGLVISFSHQFDVPFIPGEPTIPVPELGNVGLPAGLYTASTSITFGSAISTVNATASGVSSSTTPSTSPAASLGAGFFPTAVTASGFATGGSNSTVPVTGPGSAAGSGVAEATPPTPTAAADFPIHGIPPPLGWSITALLACLLAAYPLLLLARWQFVTGRRS
jgi:hypothetical protein